MTKFLSNAFFFVGVISAGPMGYVYLFGIAGSNPPSTYAMIVSHACFVAFSYYSKKNPLFLVGAFIALSAFALSYESDLRFRAEQNKTICEKLRSDPHCQLGENGYSCEEPSKLKDVMTGLTCDDTL